MDDMMPSMTLAGFSVGSAVMGAKLGSHLPVGTPNALNELGSSTGSMVAPIGVLSGGVVASKQLKKLIKSMKGLG